MVGGIFQAAGVPASTGPFEALVIGASFGGPKAIERLLVELPRRFSLPVAICQHITPGMTSIWADTLCAKCRVKVVEAKSHVAFEPGVVYIAPVGKQMRLVRMEKGPIVRLDNDFADSLHVPSIDVLFSSAAQAFGSRTLAVLLTGMGSDGSTGMLQIRQTGGYTIGESAETAVSYSMPGSAHDAGAIVEQLPLDRIARRVVELGAVG